jgi:hypothetical protein
VAEKPQPEILVDVSALSLVADEERFVGVLMQFVKVHGLALAILGVVLLGLQIFFYMVPNKVISGTTEAATPKVEHGTNPAAGILGVISLIAGVGIFFTRRKADGTRREIRRQVANISLSRPAISFVLNLSF